MNSNKFADLLVDSPRRPPDWVWSRAQHITSGVDPGPSRARDGKAGAIAVRRAAAFLRELQATATLSSAKFCEWAAGQGASYWAYSYYHGGGPARAQIEARILARQTDEQIAEALGTQTEVISQYASWFFDVRSRLGNPDYIMHYVIGEQVHQQLLGTDYGVLWRLYGYFLGPHVLQALVTKFHSPTFCSSESAVIAALQDDMISTAKIKAALAAKTIGVDSATQYDLMKIFADTLRVETTIRGIAAGNSQLMAAVSGMLAALPYTVDGRDPVTGEARVGAFGGRRYDQSNVILTADEQVGRLLGHTPADPTLSELEGATFQSLSRDSTDAYG